MRNFNTIQQLARWLGDVQCHTWAAARAFVRKHGVKGAGLRAACDSGRVTAVACQGEIFVVRDRLWSGWLAAIRRKVPHTEQALAMRAQFARLEAEFPAHDLRSAKLLVLAAVRAHGPLDVTGLKCLRGVGWVKFVAARQELVDEGQIVVGEAASRRGAPRKMYAMPGLATGVA